MEGLLFSPVLSVFKDVIFTFKLLLCTHSLVFREHQGFCPLGLSPVPWTFIGCLVLRSIYLLLVLEECAVIARTAAHFLRPTPSASCLPSVSCDYPKDTHPEASSQSDLPYNSYGFMLARGLLNSFTLFCRGPSFSVCPHWWSA